MFNSSKKQAYPTQDKANASNGSKRTKQRPVQAGNRAGRQQINRTRKKNYPKREGIERKIYQTAATFREPG